MKSVISLIAASLLLTSCSAMNQEKAGIIVSSQNYANIAKSLMGENQAAQFDIHVLLASDAIDPHEFEPSAQDKLAISEAEAVFYAGTDFDSFVDPLLESVNFDPAFVVKSSYYVIEKSASCATELCLEKGSNPHLWFDLDTISKSAEALTALFSKLRPEYSAEYASAGEAFQARLSELQAKQAVIMSTIDPQTTFFAPEAIANVLLLELGLTNASSKTISQKIANEVELSLLEMQQVKDLMLSNGVSLFAANQQVESVQAEELQSVAESANTPIVFFSESSLCKNKSDAFLDCFDDKIDEIASLLDIKLD